MKSFLKLIVISFFLTWAVMDLNAQQVYHYNGMCTQGAVKAQTSGLPSSNSLISAIPLCLVTVYITGTTTLATLFADQSGTTLSNPFTAQKNSLFSFYTASGYYDIQNSGPGMQTTTLQNVGIGPSGSSSSNILPTPQNIVFMQPNPGSQSIAGPSVKNVNSFAPMMQGQLNSDGYISAGNDGIANALASPPCATNCDVFTPVTSTSTEQPVMPTSSSRLADYRGNAGAVFAHNPHTLAMTNNIENLRSCNGFASAYCAINYWDTTDITQMAEYGHSFRDIFNSPGVDYGNCPNCGSTQWTGQKIFDIQALFLGRGIGQVISSNQSDKYAIGDFAAMGYFYGWCDGGTPDFSGEGCSGMNIQNGEEPNFFHGIVASGATTGMTSLPVYINLGPPVNRQVTSDGAYMLDITQGNITGNITGPSTQVSGYPTIYSIPIDTPITATTTYGNMGCDLPVITNPADPNGEQSVVCTINNIVGPAYQTTSASGLIGIIGGDFPEQVVISAVGSLSGGSQSVTFSYHYPHVGTKTTFWQSTLNAQFIVYDRSVAINNFPEPNLHVFGLIDSTHLAVQGWRNNGGFPQTPYIAPIAITSLSKSGTTVTAQFPLSSTNGALLFNQVAAAVIAGCSDSNLNGTVTSVLVTVGDVGTISWTQSGGGTSCPSATISLPQSYFGYHLYPGAEQRGPAGIAPTSGTPLAVTLEPNMVPWTTNDLLQEPHHPFLSSTNIHNAHQIFNSMDQSNTTGAWEIGSTGAGISGSYKFARFTNANNCAIYFGCGGTLTAPAAMSVEGPNGGGLRMLAPPLDNQPIIFVGLPLTNGGVANKNPIILTAFSQVNGANFTFYPDIGANGAMGGMSWYGAGTNVVSANHYGIAFGGLASITHTAVPDVWLSRQSAGTWQMGTTSTGHNGSLELNHITVDTDITVPTLTSTLTVNTSKLSLGGSQSLTSVQGSTGTKLIAGAGSFTTGQYLSIDGSGNAIGQSLPIASVGTNGISQPDNSTIGITGGGVLSTKGFTGKCTSPQTPTFVNGVATGCS